MKKLRRPHKSREVKLKKKDFLSWIRSAVLLSFRMSAKKFRTLKIIQKKLTICKIITNKVFKGQTHTNNFEIKENPYVKKRHNSELTFINAQLRSAVRIFSWNHVEQLLISEKFTFKIEQKKRLFLFLSLNNIKSFAISIRLKVRGNKRFYICGKSQIIQV